MAVNDATNQTHKGRFMPQDIFDGCVLAHLIAKETKSLDLFPEMIAQYLSAQAPAQIGRK
jgi:hypothetical protein